MGYPFRVRRAVPEDREEVLRISRAIHQADWVAGAWEEFMAEPGPGGLYVAEQNGRMVGFYHLTLTERQDAFFSAMRIDPALQGQGIGSLFCRAQVEQAVAAGARWIHLFSVLENRAAHRTVQKNGFANLGEWVIYDSLPCRGTGKGGGARPAAPADAPLLRALRRRLAADPLDVVIAVPHDGWTLQAAAEADWEPAGWWVVDEPNGLAGAMLLGTTRGGLCIRRLEGSTEAAAELLAAAAETARARGCSLGASLPARAEVLLQALGPDPASAFRAYVFRREGAPRQL